MDFVMGLPKTKSNHDTVWLVVDRLTKSSHSLAIKMNDQLDKQTRLYIKLIVRLYGIAVSVVLDKDLRFTSRFWNYF